MFSPGFSFVENRRNLRQYYIIYKPFRVLSQFSPAPGKRTLKDLFAVAGDVYPVGRLDFDSEGLLILTNDGRVNHRLLDPGFAHEREYWVQVEGTIGPDALHRLETGLTIHIDGKPYSTRPAKAGSIVPDPAVPDRTPPVRYRAAIPTSWISLTLTEGKNRQVRKMTAQTGFPTLRLIRHRIEGITIAGLEPGKMRSLTEEEVNALLFAKRNQ